MKRVVAVALLLSTACFYHNARIELSSSTDARTPLTSAEVAEATAIVAKVVSERGFVADPDAKRIEDTSRTDQEWPDVVVASFSPTRGQWPDDGVGVSVLVEKATGRYRVQVRNLDSPFATDFTDALETSLTEALDAAFPAGNVRVERETVGPMFGP
jgi:hypothetical protein